MYIHILRTRKKIVFLTMLVCSFLLIKFSNINNQQEPTLVDRAQADIPYCSPCGCPWTEAECTVWSSDGDGSDGGDGGEVLHKEIY